MFVFPPRPRLSAGERQFYIAALIVALMGALLAHVSLSDISAQGHVQDLHLRDPMTLWTLAAGAIGAVAGFGSTYARWFGYAGTVGWIRALYGGVGISLVGSVVGGTLILPYYGTMFGPFQLVIVMIAHPLLALAWVAVLAAVHWLLIPWQAERDSIFRAVKEPLV